MKFLSGLVSLLIIIAVLIPGSKLPDVNIGGYDKLIHMIMFGAWGVAVRYDFDTKPFRYVIVFVAGLLFSVLTEVLQILVEGRSFDIYDMVADTAGLIIGLWLSAPIVKWMRRFI